jgi:UDP-glucose 4-epimerase
MRHKILVTGGAGYIGSHTTLALLQAGYDVIVIDDLSNSSKVSLERIADIAGRKPVFIEGDLKNAALLNQVFQDHSVESVFHFAALKSVAESVREPLRYFENNLVSTMTLCQAMASANVFNLVFSSSAVVYGAPSLVPIAEHHPTGQTTNPYGRSKFMIEQMLGDLAYADSRWKIAVLRYFNPVGAHASGRIGEDPNGIPNNLMPYICRVAVGALTELNIFGNDYPTIDGTGVRDYIHVLDLADGHISALEAIRKSSGIHIWNLGTGQGHSVLEVLNAFEEVSGRPIPYKIAPRRAGDVATCFADVSKAERELGWKAKFNLNEMLRDAWAWQSTNPLGYKQN